MPVKIHELAAKEFDEAIEWYELQSKGLGQRFKKSVIEHIDKITEVTHFVISKCLCDLVAKENIRN